MTDEISNRRLDKAIQHLENALVAVTQDDAVWAIKYALREMMSVKGMRETTSSAIKSTGINPATLEPYEKDTD